MKITFEETIGRKEWIHKELMSSLSGEIILDAREKGYYDVKLLVNGNELEPKFFNSIMNNVEKYVDGEAKILAKEKIEEIHDTFEKEMDSLVSIIREVKGSLMEKYGIEEDHY